MPEQKLIEFDCPCGQRLLIISPENQTPFTPHHLKVLRKEARRVGQRFMKKPHNCPGCHQPIDLKIRESRTFDQNGELVSREFVN